MIQKILCISEAEAVAFLLQQIFSSIYASFGHNKIANVVQ
jgi:hypothetical protein